MTDQLIACHLFCYMLHSVLLSGRLEFDPPPQQILFLRKCPICSLVSIALCTVIREIWHNWHTGYVCPHDFNNSVSCNMSIMRISEVEAISTVFCTWFCNCLAVICGLTMCHVKLQLPVRQQFAVQFVFCAGAERKANRQPQSAVSTSITLRQAARLPLIIKLNCRA
jgi:hypothetical protein